jgi:hypothetical protein
MSSDLTSIITVQSRRTCNSFLITCLHVPCSRFSTRCLSEWVNSPVVLPCQRTQFNPPPGLFAGLLHFLFVLYVTLLAATFFRGTVFGQFVFFVSSASFFSEPLSLVSSCSLSVVQASFQSHCLWSVRVLCQ